MIANGILWNVIGGTMTGSISLEASQLSVGETDGTVLIAFVRTGDLSGPATIEFATSSDSATDGEDYVGSAGTVTMAANQERIVIPIEILDDDASEATQTFTLSIVDVDNTSTLLFPRTVRVNILDDENPVVDPPEPPLISNYLVTEQPVISNLVAPIAFEFVPQNDASPGGASLIYVAQKPGQIRVFDQVSGSFLPDLLDLSAQVNSDQDRGLLDIALHPDFLQQPYVYAFYVVDPPDTAGQTGEAGPDGSGNRFAYVVRYTADAANDFKTVVAGSEVILLGGAGQSLADISGGGAIDSTDNFTQPESGVDAETGVYVDDYIKVDSRSHAGGALAFGPDGALYVSVGDGTSFNTPDARSASVQNLDSLSGKILRVDPITGLGLPDNPFVDGDSLSANHSKVFQLGLRNPFSMGFDQDGRLFISNTGWFTWEEIESGPPGANFGWPYYEGGDNGVIVRAPGGYQGLDGADAFYAAVDSGDITITAALRAFAHASEEPGFANQAITAGDVIYTGSQYPAEFQSDFFFADATEGTVFVVDVNDRRDIKFLYQSDGVPVHFTQGPDGYVYYADLVNGEVGRLLISSEDGPVAVPDTATTAAGAAVDIDVLANDTDPDGDVLTIIAVSDPPTGTAVINAGTPGQTSDFVTYTPDPGFSGSDFFTYTVFDGASSRVASVSVNVTPPPFGGFVFSLIDADNPDTVLDGSLSQDEIVNLSAADFAGTLAVSAVAAGAPIIGPVTLTLDNLATAGVDFSRIESVSPYAIFGDFSGDFAGQTLTPGSYQFSADNNGQVSSVRFTLVQDGGVQVAPVISSAGAVTVPDGAAGTVLDVDASDANGDLLAYSITAGPDAVLFAIDGQTGAVSFLSPPSFAAPLDQGADNIYDFTVGVSDGAATTLQDVAVTVAGDVQSSKFLFQLFNADTDQLLDADLSDGALALPAGTLQANLAVAAIAADGPLSGAVSLALDDLATAGVDFTRVESVAPYAIFGDSSGNFAGQALAAGSYQFSATHDGDIESVTFSLSEDGTNAAPVINSAASAQVVEGSTGTVLDVNATDANGDTIAYAIASGPDALLFDIDSQTGAVSFVTAPRFSEPADQGGDNIYNFTVAASDGTATTTQNAAITVTSDAQADQFVFALVDADTDQVLDADLSDGVGMLPPGTLQANLAVAAFAAAGPVSGAVSLTLDNLATAGVDFSRVESVEPYAIFGDTVGDFNGQLLQPGSYLLTAANNGILQSVTFTL